MKKACLRSYFHRHSFQEKLFIVATLAPALIVQFIFVLLPTAYSFYLSLYDTTILKVTNFVGLKHFTQLFEDPIFAKSLVNTIYFTSMTVIMVIPVGLALALLLNKHIKGFVFFRASFFLPMVLSYAAFVVIWYWLYDPRYGMLNFLLGYLGISPIPWLESSTTVIPAFILMNVWKRAGFAMVIFLAGLQAIPQDLYEAATVDGAGTWSKFRFITLPLLYPMVFFVALMTTISCMQLFLEPFMMTKGGPANSSVSVVYLVYQAGFRNLELGRASAMAFVLFLLIFGITVLLQRYFTSLEVGTYR